MKNLFPGHFKNSDDEISQIWDNALFVFDANIILNLYRYSDKSRAEFLELLKSIQNRIWMPHRAVDEYLSNRASTIQGQEKAYDSTIGETKKLVQKLENAKQHPFVSPETLAKIKDAFSELETELSSGKEVHAKRLHQDEIKTAIGEIFTNAVGQPFTDKQLKDICTEGENRYNANIPPGYKDASKGKDDTPKDNYRKFGDLIVWKQIIEKSESDKIHIIFVTDDKKEDWWEQPNGKTIGPRPELIKEFADTTSQKFLMYTADSFLTLSKDKLQGIVSDELLNETRELRIQKVEDAAPTTNKKFVRDTAREQKITPDQVRKHIIHGRLSRPLKGPYKNAYKEMQHDNIERLEILQNLRRHQNNLASQRWRGAEPLHDEDDEIIAMYLMNEDDDIMETYLVDEDGNIIDERLDDKDEDQN